MFSIFWPFKVLSSLVRFLLNITVMVTCLLTVVSVVLHDQWPYSLIVHFRPFYFWILLTATLLTTTNQLLAKKKPPEPKKTFLFIQFENLLSSGILVFCLFINTLSISPYWLVSNNHSGTPGKKLKLLHINLQGNHNRENKKIASLIQSEAPDLIDLVEFVKPWPALLSQEGILQQYPYLIERPGNIVLLSKTPIQNKQQLLSLKPGKYNATIQATTLLSGIRLNGQAITLLIGDPSAPLTPEMDKINQLQLESWGNSLSKAGKNILVVGDFSTTPWTKRFSKLLKAGKLNDSQKQFGMQASWPAVIPVPLSSGYLEIPPALYQTFGLSLDHVLSSSSLSLSSRRTGPVIGSDHLPIIVEFALNHK